MERMTEHPPLLTRATALEGGAFRRCPHWQAKADGQCNSTLALRNCIAGSEQCAARQSLPPIPSVRGESLRVRLFLGG